MDKDIIYEENKETIIQKNLTPEKYEKAIKELAKDLDI